MRAGKSTRMLELWQQHETWRRVWLTHQLHRHGVLTHGKRECPISERITSLVEWAQANGDAYDVVFIDEAQFFNAADLVAGLAALSRKAVYISGLDRDYRRREFAWLLVGQPWTQLERLAGQCQVCKCDAAPFTAYTGPPFSGDFAPESEDFLTVCDRCWTRAQ